jgi:hypothetical protein
MEKANNYIRAVLALLLVLGWVYGASAAVTLSGSLDGASPTWDRVKDDGTDSYNDGVPYAVFEIMTDTAENLVAVVNSAATDIDTFFALYDGPFNPAAPTLNLIAADDDSGGYPHAGFDDADGVLLSPNVSYFMVVTGYSATDGAKPALGDFEVDLGGNVVEIEPTPGRRGSSGSGCFIATAAHGSPMADDVKVLRRFRDRSLITNPAGRAFVRFYYRYSPPVADFIGRHNSLRTATRWALTPVVFGVKHPMGALLFAAVMAGTAMRGIRRRTVKRRN